MGFQLISRHINTTHNKNLPLQYYIGPGVAEMELKVSNLMNYKVLIKKTLKSIE